MILMHLYLQKIVPRDEKRSRRLVKTVKLVSFDIDILVQASEIGNSWMEWLEILDGDRRTGHLTIRYITCVTPQRRSHRQKRLGVSI